MKSKFGFIPIVLPVLVMVLIVGLINLQGPRGAQAHTTTEDHTHPNVNLTFTALGSDGNALNGGIRLATDSAFDGENNEVVALTAIGSAVTYNISPGLVFSSDAVQVRVTHSNTEESITINEIAVPSGDVGLRYALSDGKHQFQIVGEDLATGVTTGPETLYLLSYTKEKSGPPQAISSDLEGTDFYFQVGVELAENTTDYPLFPPARSGTGNGAPVYTLVGIGVNGEDSDLPGGLTFNLPGSGRSDGWGHLSGTPTLADGTSQDVHTMEYRIADSDGDTSDSDMLKIRFTITVGRMVDPTPGTGSTDPTTPPGPGQPKNIEILYAPVSEGKPATVQSADLIASDGVKGFRLAVDSYRATIPHDVVFATLRVTVPTTTTEVTANRAIVNILTTQTDTTCGTDDPCYRWQPRRIDKGVANEYVIRVTSKDKDGKDVTGVYEVDIRREINSRPEFSPTESGDIALHYYSQMVVSDTAGNRNLPAVKLPVAALGTGNGDTSTLLYTLENKDNTSGFLGLTYSGGDGGGDTTTAPGSSPNPMLAGTTRPTRDRARDADISSVFAKYTVRDRDLVEGSSDESSIDVDIHVYRDATLSSYRVGVDDQGQGGSGPASLDTSTRMYKAPPLDADYKEIIRYSKEEQNYRWDDADISSYTHYVSHKLKTTTLMVTAKSSAAEISLTPSGGKKTSPTGATKNVHTIDLTLGVGDNEVTVDVKNGAVMATHVLNIRRPGLTANSISIGYYENDAGFLYASDDATAEVELSPDFDHENYGPYTGKVPVDVNSVRVGAAPKVTEAEVAVNDFKVSGESDARVVDLDVGMNRIEVAIVDGPNSETYVLNITREANTPPEFTSVQEDLRVKADKKMATHTLPMAMGGNGDLEYSLNEEELPEGVSFGTTTDAKGNVVQILFGTPTLDEGYESDFDLVYTVTDSDSYTANDSDTLEFTLTVTYGPVADPSDPGSGDPGRYPPGEGPATLHDIDVTYTQMRGTPAVQVERVARLDPAFDPETADYNVIVPHDNTGVHILLTRTERDAKVTMNNTRIDRGEKTILPPAATIRVTHGTSSMTYTLTINEGVDDTPSFAKTVADMTFPIGSSITPVQLPEAVGGNGDISYSLGDKRQGIIPDGLSFNSSPSSRTLTGRPRLRDDARRTLYEMVYTATDDDGSTTTDEFMITICNPAQHDNCTGTTQPTNPGYTPMEQSVSRTGGSATMTWTPGDDSAKQEVVAVDMSDITGSILATFAQLEGDASRHDFSNLTAGVNYIYIVISYDAAGNYKDANGNGYWVTHTESGN